MVVVDTEGATGSSLGGSACRLGKNLHWEGTSALEKVYERCRDSPSLGFSRLCYTKS